MQDGLNVLSLFTGAGGLDLGLEQVGFQTRLCVENDTRARETLLRNRPSWTLAREGDALAFARDPATGLREAQVRRSEIALLAGGPPCQPFSKASHWTKKGPTRMRDPRAKTIGAYLRILSHVRPDALIFENVAGFAFKGQHQGYRALVKGIREINRICGTRYEPQLIQLNAADYGVPQLRERIFVVAHRLGRRPELPPPTHGPRASTGDRYRTSWDAIGDLDQADFADELLPQGKWAGLLPTIPEGRNYLWHTPGERGRPLFGWRTRYWSFLLKLAKSTPSWTISASPGPATGPFHWRNRLLSPQEMCRLQTFPSDFTIDAPRRIAQLQIGNAVPPALGELLGREIRRQLLRLTDSTGASKLIPKARTDCPDATRPARVPKQYLHMAGSHKPHPGTGKGPGRVVRNVAVQEP